MPQAPPPEPKLPVTLAQLTPRQISVAALIAKAWPDKRIAAELGMSDRRVRIHVTAIAYLIGADPLCSTRMQIAFWYREQCPVTLSDALRPALLHPDPAA